MITIIKNFFDEDEVVIRKDIVRMRVFNLFLTFFFLLSFLFIERIPLDILFKLHDFFTNSTFLISVVLFSVLTFLLGFIDKNWNLSITVIIILLGQLMFINVFADKYSTGVKTEAFKKNNKPKIRYHYSNTWNIG